MLPFVSALLSAVLLQSAPAPAVDLNAVTTEITGFASAFAERDYVKTEAQVAPLVARYAELDQAIAAADAVKDASSREFTAECRKARKQLVENFTRVVKEPRAPAKLQQKVIATFGVQPDDGEKLALAALSLDHISSIPESQAAAITALGSLRKTKYIEVFEKQLGDTRADVLNAAAHAMGEYFGEKEEMRKRIVARLILAYESAGMGVSPGNTAGPKRTVTDSDVMLNVRHEFQIALARLTGGVHFDRAKLWAEWYRAQKTAKWKDGVDKVSIQLDGIVPGPAPGPPAKH